MILQVGTWRISLDAFLENHLLAQERSPKEIFLFRMPSQSQGKVVLNWQVEPPFREKITGRLVYKVERASFPLRVYAKNDGSTLVCFTDRKDGNQSFFRFSTDYRRMSLIINGPDLPCGLDRFFSRLGQMFAFSVLHHGGLVLHAVVIRWRGKAILISAASGTGKTTHLIIWKQKENIEVINGDRALCGQEDGVWTAYGQPWCGSSGECLNTSAPIGAVVLLERREENSVMRLEPFDAVLGLLPRTFAPPWDGELMDAALGHLDSLAASVPVFRLRCRPDAEAVETLKAALEPLFPQGGGQG